MQSEHSTRCTDFIFLLFSYEITLKRSQKHAHIRHATGTESYLQNFLHVIREISAETRRKLMSDLSKSESNNNFTHYRCFYLLLKYYSLLLIYHLSSLRLSIHSKVTLKQFLLNRYIIYTHRYIHIDTY